MCIRDRPETTPAPEKPKGEPIDDEGNAYTRDSVSYTHLDVYKRQLYYGLNALSNNMIMVDRKQLKNPNGLILVTPGSGKSFSAKREMTNAFLITEDDIIAVSYTHLAILSNTFDALYAGRTFVLRGIGR